VSLDDALRRFCECRRRYSSAPILPNGGSRRVWLHPLLRPEDQVFSAMLAGLANQRLARNLDELSSGA
jgi:hypothetical protein